MKQLTHPSQLGNVSPSNVLKWWDKLSKKDKGVCAWLANDNYHIRNLSAEEVQWIWAVRFTLEAHDFNY